MKTACAVLVRIMLVASLGWAMPPDFLPSITYAGNLVQPAERAPISRFQRGTNVVGRSASLGGLSRGGGMVRRTADELAVDLDTVRANEAKEDMMRLALALQSLADLELREEGAAENVESHSVEAARAAREVLEFINRDADSPKSEGFEPGHGTFDERVQALASLFLAILKPTAQVISGNTLDLEQLSQARSGLVRIEALALTLPALVR